MQRVLHNSRYRDLDCWHTDLLSAKAVWLLPVMRRDICRHSYAVERGLVVGSCGQLLLVNFCGQLLLLPTLLSDSQVSISLVKHTWSLMNHFRTGKGHVVLTCTNAVSPSHLLVIVASDRPWTTLSTRAHYQNLKVDWICSTKRTMTQSYGWNLQQLQHLWNKIVGSKNHRWLKAP